MPTGLTLRAPLDRLYRDLAGWLEAGADLLGQRELPVARRVHEVRKRIKRARAWCRLLPRAEARVLDDALRAAHRRLGDSRDREATREALQRLSRVTQAPHAALGALLRMTDAQDSAGRRGDLAATARALRAAARLAAAHAPHTLPLPASRAGSARGTPPATLDRDDGMRLLLRQAGRLARRSRRAMRTAMDSGAPHDFHRWRRWMKYHAFVLRYLAPLWPEHLRLEARAAEQAAEWLGESQDIQLVRALLARAPLDDASRAAVTALLDREQERLLRHALSAGLHLHAESPAAYRQRLRNYAKARLLR